MTTPTRLLGTLALAGLLAFAGVGIAPDAIAQERVTEMLPKRADADAPEPEGSGLVERVLDLQGISELSLEQLMDMPVVTASGKAEERSLAAANVFIVSRDDIERHGYRSLGEMLRLRAAWTHRPPGEEIRLLMIRGGKAEPAAPEVMRIERPRPDSSSAAPAND